MAHSRWFSGRGVGVLVLVAVIAGCAAAPTSEPARVMKEGDFKLLAGHWTGKTDVQGELSSEIEGMIKKMDHSGSRTGGRTRLRPLAR